MSEIYFGIIDHQIEWKDFQIFKEGCNMGMGLFFGNNENCFFWETITFLCWC
jgi:hypothetical protein